MERDDWVVVTGAGRGIGKAIAKRLSRDGYAVIATGRNSVDLDALVAEIRAEGGLAISYLLDMSDRESASFGGIGTQLAERGSALSAIINNAGISTVSEFFQTPDDVWRDMFEINLLAPMRLTRSLQAFLLPDRSSIVNVGSILGSRAVGGAAPYAVSKAALHHATRVLSLELAAQGIRVNAVAPGFIATDMYETGHSSERKAAIAAAHPLGRVGAAEDVAGAVSFLCSEDAAFITGAVIPVDGGLAESTALPALAAS